MSVTPRFDEEELQIRLKNFNPGLALDADPKEIKFHIICLLKHEHLLFEIDLRFDSGQIVSLSFAKNCSSFVGLSKGKALARNSRKSRSKGKKLKRKKGVQIADKKRLGVKAKLMQHKNQAQNIHFKPKTLDQSTNSTFHSQIL